jgi:hypothetical protein
MPGLYYKSIGLFKYISEANIKEFSGFWGIL